MKILLLKEENINEFCQGLNAAFFARSSPRIPFKEISMKNLEKEYSSRKNIFVGIYGDYYQKELRKDGCLVGGAMITWENDFSVHLSHIWVHPECAGKGYGKELMYGLEKICSEKGATLIKLSVAHAYIPAVKLYQKCGYKKVGLAANVPDTYHFVNMIKPIPPYRYFSVKRISKLLFSTIKFLVLYDTSSNPRWITKIIYGE